MRGFGLMGRRRDSTGKRRNVPGPCCDTDPGFAKINRHLRYLVNCLCLIHKAVLHVKEHCPPLVSE